MAAPTRNGDAIALGAVRRVDATALHGACVDVADEGGRLSAMCVHEGELLSAWSDDARGTVALIGARIPESRTIRSMTPELPEAHLFERELFEDHGIHPEGHPWLKPVRAHAALEGGARDHPFFRVRGSSVHEVAVGPVHAGIIEPGHFRFECHGETVLSLEIQLGYQKRGVEALFMRSAPARRLVIAESVAGDTAVGHAVAYCEALEGLAGVQLPARALAIRGVALELERVANHVGDLGALCNDVGYLPGASWLGRLRGELLNALMDLSGNRFGRSLIVPGGVRFDLGVAAARAMDARLERAGRDLDQTLEVVFETPTVLSRFERSGIVPRETARLLGLVGIAARASGLTHDVRATHATGAYETWPIEPVCLMPGDVMARARIRWLESQRSLAWVRARLDALPEGEIARDMPAASKPRAAAVSLVEGWRGEIAHFAITDARGALAAYKIVDPSFHNWIGLALAMRGRQISDFPLCNKSFNLSYAGHDL